MADVSGPIQVSLNISKFPIINETTDVSLKVVSIYDAPNTTAEVILPEGCILSSGEVLKTLDLEANMPVFLNASIRFTQIGEFKLEAKAILEVDADNLWADLDVLYLTIGGEKSMRTPGPKYWGVAAQSEPGSATLIPEILTRVSISKVSEEKMLSNQDLPGITPSNKTLASSDINKSAPNSPGSLTVTGHYKYWTQLNDYRPAPDTYDWAKEVLIEVVRADNGASLGMGYTDLNGYFSITIQNPGNIGFKVINYAYTKYSVGSNPELRVVEDEAGGTTGLDYVWRWTTDSVLAAPDGTTDIGTWYPKKNYEACWLLSDLQRSWKWVWFYDNRHIDVGQGTIVWFPTSTIGTHYHPGGQIHLNETDAKSADTVIHEYAHNIMYNKYDKWFPQTNCPKPHYLGENEDIHCAWTEGWANFLPLVINSNPTYTWGSGGHTNLETPTWGTPSQWHNGDGVEGRVAGALWDMYDTANDGGDIFSFGFNEIEDLVFNKRQNHFYDFWMQWQSNGYSTDAARCLNQNTIPPAKPIALRANNGQYLCAELGGGGIVSATRNWIGGWETFGLVNLGSGNAAIRASNGQYVCAEGGGGNRVVADRSARSYWETFGLEDLGNGNVALKASDGHYVCAELGGGDDVVANRPSRGAWETFKLIDLTPQPVALRASNGQYVVAEFGGGDGVFANRPVPSIWETFGLINLGSNNVALRANNGQYFVAEFGGGDGVFAYRDWIGAWETFELKDQGSGNVALRANNGQYVCAENGGGYGVVANRDDIGAWETFARVNTPRINTDPIEIWPGENNTVKDEWASTRNNNGSGCASC